MEEPETDDVDLDLDEGVQSQCVSASSPHSWDGSNHGGGGSSSRSGGPPQDIRLLRNQLEKDRRNRVNQLVNAMSETVPLVRQCSKKPVKITVLRLTASYLRSYHIFRTVFEASGGAQNNKLPLHLGQEAENLVLENMNAVFFVLDYSGKIVYVSKLVETLLGHQDLDLLGTDFKNLVHTRDHRTIEQCLRPDGESLRALESITSSEDSSSDDTGTSTSTSSDSPMGEAPGSPSGAAGAAGAAEARAHTMTHQPRSFRVLVQHKATGKEGPQYEQVQATGKLILIDGPSSSPGGRDPAHGHRRRSQDTERTVLLAFILKLTNNTPCSIMAATLPQSNDEYKTRHAMDGKFLDSDHRIALVSGYVPNEVRGFNAFIYMHEEDARWAQVALQQMFKNNQPTGFSVYRLKAKNGEYIYLRTEGYLETNSDGIVDSFVCNNKLVTAEEAEKVKAEMKRNLSPNIVELPDDTPADTFANQAIMGPQAVQAIMAPQAVQAIMPPQAVQVRSMNMERESVLKRCKRGTVAEHALGGDMKRLRFAAPPALAAITDAAGAGSAGAGSSRALDEQGVAQGASALPVPVLAPGPGAAGAPGLLLGISDAMDEALSEAMAGSLDASTVLSLAGDLDHDVVFSAASSIFPNAELGRPEFQVQTASTHELNLVDSNIALFQGGEAPAPSPGPGVLFSAQAGVGVGVAGMSVGLPPQTLQAFDPQRLVDPQDAEAARDLLQQQQEIGTNLRVAEEIEMVLRENVNQLPVPERTNLSDQLTQFQEERSRQKKQLEDLSRQTNKLYS